MQPSRAAVLRRLARSRNSGRLVNPLQYAFFKAGDPVNTSPVRVHAPKQRTVGITHPIRRAENTIVVYERDQLRPEFPPPFVGQSGRSEASLMGTFFEVGTTPTADTPGTCLILRTQHKSYLFGRVAEGTQRALSQKATKINNISTHFITGPVGTETLGGFIGFMLTTVDSRKPMNDAIESRLQKKRKKDPNAVLDKDKVMQRIDVYGGPNLNYWLATQRHFIFRQGLPIKTWERRDDPRLLDKSLTKPDFEDINIKVWQVPVHRKLEHRRKRSHDEAEAEDGQASAAPDQEALDREAIETIVSHMFSSSWSRHALTKKKLSEVPLPAAVFVKNESGEMVEYAGPLPEGGKKVPDMDVWVREPWPAGRHSHLPAPAPSRTSTCYIVHSQERRGKFNVNLAEQLGVPKIKRKALCTGSSVTLDDGRVISPDGLFSDPIPGSGVAVVDIPEESYVESFLSRPEWKSDELMKKVECMFWIMPPAVSKLPEIQEFMRSNSHLEHVVSTKETSANQIIGKRATAMLSRAHFVDKDRFPIPKHSNTTVAAPEDIPAGFARPGQRLHTFPRYRNDDEEVLPMFTHVPSLGDHRYMHKLIRTAQATVQSPSFLKMVDRLDKDLPNKDAEVVALGTGSAIPSNYRNVSSTLLRVPGFGSYIFDCGEGTLGQLHRLYGEEEAREILRDLRCLVISHGHADHHLGSARLLQAWGDATHDTQSKLTVVAGPNMIQFYHEFDKLESLNLPRIEFIADNPNGEVHSHVRTKLPGSSHPSGLVEVVRVCVDHCKWAYATMLVWPTGLKVAYSGDCRPNPTFARVCNGCTVLIHEATLEDDRVADAMAKMHCTYSEALRVASDMGAKRVLLTHFSQRYQAYPRFRNQRILGQDVPEDQVVLGALDFMTVKIGEWRHAKEFVPGIALLASMETGEEAGEPLPTGEEAGEAVPAEA